MKNVTGYDIHKLMIGALGTLGVMTRLNFKTFPLPAATRGFVARFPTTAQACEMRNRIAASPLSPLTLDILSPQVAGLFSAAAPPSKFEPDPMPPNVFVEFGMDSDHWLLRPRRSSRALRSGFAPDRHGQWRHRRNDSRRQSSASLGAQTRIHSIVIASSPAATIVKISVLPSRLKDVLATAQEAAGANSLPWASLARGVGVVYFALLPPNQNEDSFARVRTATSAIHQAAAKLEANSTIPWCPAP